MNFLQFTAIPELWVDAYVCDKDDYLLFLSAWGSESNVQQLRARLSLPKTDDKCLRRLVSHHHGRSIKIGDPNRFNSRVGRPQQSTLFNLTQVWIFDQSTIALDGNKQRSVLLKRDTESDDTFRARLWQAVVALCPIPLLMDWSCLLDDFKAWQWITKEYGFAVSATLLNFSDEKAIANCIAENLRGGRLALPVH